MSGREITRRLTGAAMFALPIALLKIVAVSVGTGDPAGASAAAPAAAASAPIVPVVVPDPLVWSDAQVAAAAYVERLRGEPFGDTPMFYQPKEPVKPVTIEPVEIPTVLELTAVVTLIIDGDQGAIAIIDGAAKRQGDHVGEGRWRITRIDARERCVHFTSEDTGQTVVRAVSR